MKTNILVCSILLGLSALWTLGWLQNPLLSEENGPMENFQAAALLMGLIPCCWAVVRDQSLAQRILCGGLALLFATFIVLEVDIRKFDAPLLNKLFNGRIRDLWLGVLWGVAGILFLRHRSAVWQRFTQWLFSGAGWYMLAAGGLWVCSAIVDKLSLFPESHHFFEELLEINATFLMFVSALLTVKTRRQAPTDATLVAEPFSH